ncbi:MAG: hypothetical protein CMF39_03595 [Legionellaceae bacterium]|nr:hypothetical protein [Legionellaceae bacterium]|tara:strand:- start:2015 stop:2386 length:372 start_codon:yes stop_codon:yes gene_type:complete
MPAEDNNTRERHAAREELLELRVGPYERWIAFTFIVSSTSYLMAAGDDQFPGIADLMFGLSMLLAVECAQQYDNTGVLDVEWALPTAAGLFFGSVCYFFEPWLGDMPSGQLLYGSPAQQPIVS